MAKEETKEHKNWFVKHKVWTGVLIFVGLGIIGSVANPPKTETTNTSNQSTTQQAQPPKPDKKTSQQIYDETQVGQTKEAVIANAGHAPDNCIDSQIAGVGESSTCSWGTLSITFIDGKVSSKTKL